MFWYSGVYRVKACFTMACRLRRPCSRPEMAYTVRLSLVLIEDVKLTNMLDVCEKGGIVGRGILVDWVRK